MLEIQKFSKIIAANWKMNGSINFINNFLKELDNLTLKNTHDKSVALMHSTNPLIIPRNHKVEEALTLATNGDLTLFNKLIEILKNPYQVNSNDVDFMSPAPHSNKKYQTFCGT